jgi:hypothetical protein
MITMMTIPPTMVQLPVAAVVAASDLTAHQASGQHDHDRDIRTHRSS